MALAAACWAPCACFGQQSDLEKLLRDSLATAEETQAKTGAVAGSSMLVLDDRRVLRPGDRLSFRVVEDRSAPLSLRVSDSGEVEVPMLGRMSTTGRTCKSLAYAVKQGLEKEYYNKANVIIGLENASTEPLGTVYITGQVKTQGPIEMTTKEPLTVSKAILKAGGFADFANKRRVFVVRRQPDGGTKRITVDVKEILERGHIEKDVALEPGDYVVIPENLINF